MYLFLHSTMHSSTSFIAGRGLLCWLGCSSQRGDSVPPRGCLPLGTVWCAQTQRPASWRILGAGLCQASAVLVCTTSSMPRIHQGTALSCLWTASPAPVASGAPPGRCVTWHSAGAAVLRGPLSLCTPACASSSPDAAAPCSIARSPVSSPSSCKATLPTASGSLWNSA